MSITFDPAAKRIILDSAYNTVSAIYSRWIDWAAQSDNLKWGAVFRWSGLDPLPGGRYSPVNFFLQGAWRVRPMEADHTLDIEGNLYCEDGVSDPVVPTLGNYRVLVRYTVPVQAQGIATSGSTGPSADQIAAAVLAALQTSTTPFPSNVTHFNGNPTVGSGQPNDPVRPA